ncbi:MAG: glycerol-3-phosphate dehydrogenase [Legionellaceae bacterium]|nr:glycerol-3-phosphate dehydrogenase [Legionellaceae bacterium]
MHDGMFDIAIIGGGINGCAIAADAALRGLKVILFEKNDIAGGTSSNSTKLIHGGLRYLSQWHFAWVRKAIRERQRLLNNAPHIVHPIPLVFTKSLEVTMPDWTMRCGLFLYDHLSRYNHLPKSQQVNREVFPEYFSPLDLNMNEGFLLYDAQTNDARLTIANAQQAKRAGAHIVPQAEVFRAQAHKTHWNVEIQPSRADAYTIQTKVLINAAGPWVNTVHDILGVPSPYPMAYVQGTHILLDALYEQSQGYMFTCPDRRIIFVLPYQGYTLIGTTETPLASMPEYPTVLDEEVDYLCRMASQYMQKPIDSSGILQTWCGIRGLIQSNTLDAHTLDRSHTIHRSKHPAPLISIYGGKLTTHRLLAQEVLDPLRKIFPTLVPCSTAHRVLPGSENFADIQTLKEKFAFLPVVLLHRYITTYGSNIATLLENCHTLDDLGQDFGHGLYQKEVEYLWEHEWARTPEDILWRRTLLGVEWRSDDIKALIDFLKRGCSGFVS